jgi:hypothetical protein
MRAAIHALKYDRIDHNAQTRSFETRRAQTGIEPANQFASMHSSSSTHQLS